MLPDAPTLLCLSFIGFLYFGLSMNVSMKRRRYRVSFGDGGFEDLNRAIRAHANLTEFAPILIILLATINWLLRQKGAYSDFLIYVYAGLIIIARMAHAYGLLAYKKPNIFRMMGALFSYLLILTGFAIVAYHWIVLEFLTNRGGEIAH